MYVHDWGRTDNTIRMLQPGGSQLSGGGIIFLRVIRRHLLACGHGPGGSPLSASPRTVLFRWLSFVDHIDHATTERTKAVDDGEA